MTTVSEFKIDLLISPKPELRNPEGDTILQDLLLRNNFDYVTSVSVSKVIQLIVKADDLDDAKNKDAIICDELRLYIPLVSSCTIRGTE